MPPKTTVCINSVDKGNTKKLNGLTRLPEKLCIWEGASVMNIVNDKKMKIYNGERGTVVGITDNTVKVEFKRSKGDN